MNTTVDFDSTGGWNANHSYAGFTWQGFNYDPGYGVGSTNQIILQNAVASSNVVRNFGRFTAVSIAAFTWTGERTITFIGYRGGVEVARADYVLPLVASVSVPNPGTVYSFPAAFSELDRLEIDPTTDGSTVAGFDSFVFSGLNDTSTVIAAPGVAEPVDLAVTADSVGEAVDVFDFRIVDAGTSDAVSTDITAVRLSTSGTGDFSRITWRLSGPDTTNVTGTYNAGSNTITFSPLTISIADGATETYAVNAYFNTTTGLANGQTYVLSVDGDSTTSFTVTNFGSQMAANQTAVTNGTGSAVVGLVIAPTVTGVSPTTGPTAGGNSVTITGTSFTGASAVNFGGTAASSYAVNSATQITATSPAHAAGTVDITVTTAGGTSATSGADQFTYVAPPTLTTPTTSNLGANQVTLTLQSSATGTGYFTLLTGSDAAGTPAQTAAGQIFGGATATRHGSLRLTAATGGTYTVRNLSSNTHYTVCFTAENGGALADVDSTVSFTTAAAANVTGLDWFNGAAPGYNLVLGESDAVSSSSLAFAPDGRDIIAYTLSDQADSVAVSMRKPFDLASLSSWEDPDSVSTGTASSVSLAHAPDGTPYVAFHDEDSSSKATVMKLDPDDGWMPVGTAGFSAGTADHTSLAFSTDGTPYVAFGDGDNGGRATVMRFNGSIWETVGSAGFSAAASSETSLAFAPDGSPWVAFGDGDNSSKATVMRLNGSTWETVGSAGFSAGAASFLNLAFSADGVCYVGYQDAGHSAKATVMRLNGSTWENVGAAGFSDGQADNTQLALAPDGTPYVAFKDGSLGSKATVMRFIDSGDPGWETVGTPGFADNFTSLAFDPAGSPRVACISDGHNTVMNLAPVVLSYTVTTAADSGPGSLREGINTVASGVTIDFDSDLSGDTITLESPLVIVRDVTIDGSALAAHIRVSGDHLYRVFVVAGSTTTLRHLDIVNGYMPIDGDLDDMGGGIANAGATLTLQNCTLSGNSATVGGAIANFGGTLTLRDSTLSGNSAQFGGGIFNFFSISVLTVQNCTLSDNSAGSGGAIVNLMGVLTVENSTLSGNQATATGSELSGGAIAMQQGSTTLNHCTIVSNTAASPHEAASGIAVAGGELTLKNSIVANNGAGTGNFSITDGGTFTSLGYNLSDDWNGLTTTDGDPVGALTDDLTGNPLLGALADNGGETQTCALQITSPAINAADPADVTATDQRGIVRPQGSASDIGAYETVVATITGVSVPAGGSYASGQDLEFTVTFGAAVTVDTTYGTPRIALDIGGTTRYATYVSGNGTTSLLFRYSLQPGDTDGDGIAVVGASIDLNSGIITATSGGFAAVGTLNNVGSTGGVYTGTAPTFSTQPESTTINAGQLATFTVVASGSPTPTYQWQWNSGGGWSNLSNDSTYSGVTTTTLGVGATSGLNSYSYRCVATNGFSPDATSAPATLTVRSVAVLWSVYDDATGELVQIAGFGGDATSGGNQFFSVPAGAKYNVVATNFTPFTVDAGHPSQTVSFNWRFSSPLTGKCITVGLADIDAAGPVPAVLPNVGYRAVFDMTANNFGLMYTPASANVVGQWASTDANALLGNSDSIAGTFAPGTYYSTAIQLTHDGNRVTLGTGPGANAGISYTDGGALNWNSYSDDLVNYGQTPASFTVNAFVIGIHNPTGSTVTFTINSLDLVPLAQTPLHALPPANRTVVEGNATSFTTQVYATPSATYQWQRQPAGGGGFGNLSADGTYSGVTAATLSLSGTTLGMEGDQFRCVATNYLGAIPSAAATLTVAGVPTVSGLSVTSGSTAGGTSVTITGTHFTGATAVHFGGTAAPGYTVDSATQITVHSPAAPAGTVDVTVTTAGGTTATGASDRFTYVAPPTIDAQPAAAIGTALGNTSFTVAATGTSLGYQWQADFGTGFGDIVDGGVYGGATTDTLTLTGMQGGMHGYSYRVVVTSAGVVSTTSTSATLTVNKVTPAVSWTTPGAITYGTALSAAQLNATADVAGVFVYTPTTGTVLDAGTNQSLSVAFTPTDTTNYDNASGSTSITVNKANQAITFGSLTDKTYGDASFALAATADSGRTVTFSVVSGPASLSGNTVTLIGAGPVVVRASQGGNANFNPATDVDRSFTVAKAAASVSLGSLGQTYTGSPLAATATTTPASLSVNLTYDGSATAPTNAGSYAVVANVDDANYAGTASGTLAIGKADQTVVFALVGAVTVGTPVTLSATASSGLAVTFSVVSGDASLTGDQLTVNSAASTITVRAAQSGNGNYNAASSDQSIASTDITRLSQTIIFTQPGDKLTTDAAFALGATASSGLTVTFAVQSGPATISGSTVTLTGVPGTVTVVASQVGDGAYDAATPVTRSFQVTAPAPLVGFGPVSEGAQERGQGAVWLAADGAGGVLIGFIPGQGGFVLGFAPDAHTGAFTATTEALTTTPGQPAITWTFAGLVQGGSVSGTITELGYTFAAAFDPATGPTAAIAGYYDAAALDTTTGEVHTIVGTTGTIYVLAVLTDLVDGIKTTVDGTSGDFAGQAASGVAIDGTIAVGSTSIDGAIVRTGDGLVTDYAGLRIDATRTDRLINLSSRARVGSGDDVLITGFHIGGTQPRAVLLRAVGPGLDRFGVSGTLSDPRLALMRGGAVLDQNDDWGQAPNAVDIAAAFGTTGAFGLSPTSRDAALLVTLPPGTYTVVVSGADGTGVALAEIYDATTTTDAERLVNISARGFVGSSDDILIGGFIVSGNAPKRVLVRGVGPALAAFGVQGVLADPALLLYSRGAVVAENNNWGQGANAAGEIAAATAQVGAFALPAGSADAAIVVTLAPGAYTVHLSSQTEATGIGLIEVYELP